MSVIKMIGFWKSLYLAVIILWFTGTLYVAYGECSLAVFYLLLMLSVNFVMSASGRFISEHMWSQQIKCNARDVAHWKCLHEMIVLSNNTCELRHKLHSQLEREVKHERE